MREIASSRRLEQFLFFLFLLLLPTQFGKHFIFPWSSVAGIRIDYLYPTIYVTDCLLLTIFILRGFSAAPKLTKKRALHLLKTKNLWIYVILLIMLLCGVLFSKVWQPGIFLFLKLLECIGLGLYSAHFLKKTTARQVLEALGFGTVFESMLAILQFIHQGSFGGPLYFFGERTIFPSTLGVANASLHGSLILRPYATFSHPNQLAGFLVVVLVLILFNKRFFVSKWQKSLFLLSLLLGSLAILVSLSRSAIIVWMLVVFVFFVKHRLERAKKGMLLGFFLFVIIALVLFILHARFATLQFGDASVKDRLTLLSAAWNMVLSHPFFGVGLGNFLIVLPHYLSDMSYSLLQPVHNIFLLIAAETGILGLAGFGLLLFSATKRVATQKRPALTKDSLIIALGAICLLGLVDHYFYTLQQTQLLFALMVGCCFSKA